MKLQLILKGDYDSCLNAEKIWRQACSTHGIELEIIDLNSDDGQQQADQLGLRSFPALIKDKHVIAVGNPELSTAQALLGDLLEQE